MKINELIELLEEYADEHGDLDVITECGACGEWFDAFGVDVVNDVIVLYPEDSE